MPERVLVLQLKRLGDLILTAPMIGALRYQLPEAQITLVTVDGGGQLAQLIQGVDRQLCFRRGQLNLGFWLELLKTRSDLVLDVTGNDRAAFMTLLSGAKSRVAFQQMTRSGFRSRIYNVLSPAIARERHTVDHHLSLLEAAGLDPTFRGWSMAGFPEPADGPPPRYALIHPGSARKEKYWPPERWAEIINFLATQNFEEIRLTQGRDPLESEHVDAILKQTQVPVKRLTDLSLIQFTELISQASLVVSVDTVASHLAAVYERPQVVLFGPINPYPWRPRHAMARVVWAGHDHPLTEFIPKVKQLPKMEALKTETVQEAITSLHLF